MEKTTGVNLALVEFSNQVMSTGLVDMGDADNRSSMRNMLEGITYSGRAHTDTGAGLLKAEEILEEAPESDHKVIILFTDEEQILMSELREELQKTLKMMWILLFSRHKRKDIRFTVSD